MSAIAPTPLETQAEAPVLSVGDETLIIEPPRRLVSLNLRELVAYRELLYFLAWRDIKVRYKQTALGVAWAVIQPFFTMLVFSLFFGKLAHMPSDGVPYPLFAYCGLVPWAFFVTTLTESSNSLVGNSNLIKKVYFPRLLVPMATIVSAALDFAIAFCILIGMMIYYGVRPTPYVLLVPVFVLLALVTALGVGLWLSTLNVKYRDVRYTIPFVVQLWLFLTPIAYPSSLLREPWRTLYALNPMVGVADGFRWVLLGTQTSPGPMVLISAAVSLAILASGIFYFRYMERTFADVV